MLRFLNQDFITLLSFKGPLATKVVSLSNEPCIDRPSIIDLNPIDLNYHSLMISLDKCIGSCNAVDDLSMKTCLPSKTKDENVKVFDMIIRIHGAKALIKHITHNSKCKFNSTTCNSNQI